MEAHLAKARRLIVAQPVAIIVAVTTLVYMDLWNATASPGKTQEALHHPFVTGKAGFSSLWTTDVHGLPWRSTAHPTQWQPVTTLVLAVLQSQSVWLHHMVALALHCTTMWLLHSLLTLLLPGAMPAMFATLLAALHPVQVHAIAAAGSLGFVLSGLTSIAAVYCLLRSHEQAPDQGTSVWFQASLLLACITALSQGSTGLVLLLILATLDALLHPQGIVAAVLPQPARRPKAKAAPAEQDRLVSTDVSPAIMRQFLLFCLGVGLYIIWMLVTGYRSGHGPVPEAVNPLEQEASLITRTLTRLYSTCLQLSWLVLPRNLAHNWSYNSIFPIHSLFDSRNLFSGLVLLITAGIIHESWTTWRARPAGKVERALIIGATMLTCWLAPMVLLGASWVAAPASEVWLRGPSMAAAVLLAAACTRIAASLHATGNGTGTSSSSSPGTGTGSRRKSGHAAAAAAAAAAASKQGGGWNSSAVVLGSVGLALLVAFATGTAGRLVDWRDNETLLVADSANNPSNAGLWYSLGVIAHARGQQELAIQRYTQAMSLWPSYIEPMVAAAQLHMLRNQPDAASSVYKQMLLVPRRASDSDEIVVARAEGLATLSNLAQVAGDSETADARLKQAYAVLRPRPHLLKRVALAMAGVAIDERSEWLVTQALAVMDQDEQLLVEAANAAYIGGRWSTAEALLNKAIVVNPRSARALTVLALNTFAMFRTQQLRQEQGQEQQVAEGGHDMEQRAVHPDEVIMHFQDALELNPSSPALWRSFGRLHQFHTGNLQEAIVCYRKSVQLDPEDITALTNLASVLVDLGQYTAAQRTAQKAVTVAPTQYAARVNLALALLRRQHAVEARDTLLQLTDARAKAPAEMDATNDVSFDMVLATLARAFAQLGNDAGAERTCAFGNCDAASIIKSEQAWLAARAKAASAAAAPAAAAATAAAGEAETDAAAVAGAEAS